VKEHLTNPQLRNAMKVFQRTVLDSTLSLAVRGQVLFSMYRVYEEYKKKDIDTLADICDIFEFFGLFFKILDQNFKVLVDELAIIKTDFAATKKTSRIRWLNDFEQKSAEIRELLLADSAAPFVDLSKDKSMPANPEDVDLTRFEREYYFHFLHDSIMENFHSDVTRQKENKYNWIQQIDEKQLPEVLENFKENCVYRILKNLTSFVETLLNVLIEKQARVAPLLAFREMKSLKKILIHGS